MASMRIAIFGIVVSIVMFAQEPRSPVVIDVQPTLINAGESATLTWSASDATEGSYLLGIGGVEHKGQRTVSPLRTSVYTIVAEGPSGIASKSVTLKVQGSRGTDDSCSRDPERFKYAVSFDRQSKSLVEQINSLHHMLQDEMQFTIDESQTPLTPNFTFLTDCVQRGDLVQQSEKQIGARRLAYRVLISAAPESSGSNPSSSDRFVTVHYTVSALIEYRRKIESTWRLETREELYRELVRNLQQKVQNVPMP